MLEARQLERLRAVAGRKRWTIGLSANRRMSRLSAALVGSEGSALACRSEVYAAVQIDTPSQIRQIFAQLRAGKARAQAVGLLRALLAESQAACLECFAPQIAPVWDRVLAVAISEPGLWSRAGGLTTRTSLCDAARLAEICGHNIVDDFAARDLAQGGRGRSLLAVPYWVLLHDVRKTRALLVGGRRARLIYLPSSRAASAAARVSVVRLANESRSPKQDANDVEALAQAVSRALQSFAGVEELVIANFPEPAHSLHAALRAHASGLAVTATTDLGVPRGALRAAGTALLGQLHVDFVPAALGRLTGARTPRVLGQLTPGCLTNWHRLVRELAAAKPAVMTLRSAV